MQRIISPSILAADFANLQNDCQKLVNQKADWLHFDVMDGHFVPNITIGPQVVNSLRSKLPNTFFDCHLMVSDPIKWLQDFKKAGADGITFHFEAVAEGSPLFFSVNYSLDQLQTVIQSVKQLGMKVGLAFNPDTQIPHNLTNFIGELDMVLLMTVQPGFGGQKFREYVLQKVKQVRAMRPDIDIQVDGGITKDNVEQCVRAGANVIVSGTGIVNRKDAEEIIQFMKTCQ